MPTSRYRPALASTLLHHQEIYAWTGRLKITWKEYDEDGRIYGIVTNMITVNSKLIVEDSTLRSLKDYQIHPFELPLLDMQAYMAGYIVLNTSARQTIQLHEEGWF